VRSGHRATLASLLAIAIAGSISAPTAARTGTTPTVHAQLGPVTCNPAGTPGLRISASASVTNGTLRGAQLFVGEYQPVADPAYSPFSWTGMTLANWTSGDSWRRAVTSDTRTLDTRDAHTWNTRNHAIGLWTSTRPDSWWIVNYVVWPSGMDEVEVQWFVSCPGGTHVDGATLLPIEFVDEDGLR
jgi:hypothetical protein